MRRLLLRLYFLWRYLVVRLTNPGGLRTTGLVFFEPDVTFKIEKGGRVILEKGVYVKKGAIFECAGHGRILVREMASIGHYAWLGSRRWIEIGPKSHVGSYVVLFDSYHNIEKETSISETGYREDEIIIGQDVIVGTKATIEAGVHLGDWSVVGANSVVREDVAPGTYVAGAPARIIKKRNS
ncbi:MAG: acyltransferase [Thermodesulfobacteriota bacterium]